MSTASSADPAWSLPCTQDEFLADLVGGEACLQLVAFAGCGKTTFLARLARALGPEANIVVLMYNKELAKEVRDRLPANATVQTLDAFAVSNHRYEDATRFAVNMACSEQAELRPQEWSRRPKLDFLMLDEAQDLRPEHVRMLQSTFRRLRIVPERLVVAGDCFQLLYPSSSRLQFLLRPDRHLHGLFPAGAAWKTCTLRKSWRLPVQIAAFVNTHLDPRRLRLPDAHLLPDGVTTWGELLRHWGEHGIEGNPARGQGSAKLLSTAQILRTVRASLRQDPRARVLAWTVKTTLFTPTSRCLAKLETEHKGAARTIHSQKGLECDTAVVLGFDDYFFRKQNPAYAFFVYYVACTRAKKDLVVVKHAQARWPPCCALYTPPPPKKNPKRARGETAKLPQELHALTSYLTGARLKTLYDLALVGGFSAEPAFQSELGPVDDALRALLEAQPAPKRQDVTRLRQSLAKPSRGHQPLAARVVHAWCRHIDPNGAFRASPPVTAACHHSKLRLQAFLKNSKAWVYVKTDEAARSCSEDELCVELCAFLAARNPLELRQLPLANTWAVAAWSGKAIRLIPERIRTPLTAWAGPFLRALLPNHQPRKQQQRTLTFLPSGRTTPTANPQPPATTHHQKETPGV